MRQFVLSTAGVLVSATIIAGNALAADWHLDVAQSRLEFVASFQGNEVPGVFKEFTAELRLDPDTPKNNQLDVDVTVASADMTSPEINAAIRSPTWFDFANYSHAVFHSEKLRQTGAKQFVANGVLRLKGVAKPIEVPFTWNVVNDTATVTGEFTVDRGSFGIGLGEWVATDVVGASVKIRFNAMLRRTH